MRYFFNLHILPGFEDKVPQPRSPKSRFRKEVPIELIEKLQKESEIDLKHLINFDEIDLFKNGPNTT